MFLAVTVNIPVLVSSFANDKQTRAVLALIVLDLVLGVAASFKTGTFSLTYLANFARNDLLGKVFPFFVLHSMAVVAPNTDIVIPGFDMSAAADALFVIVTAAMVGSLLTSLADFGLNMPAAVSRLGAGKTTQV